MTAAPNVAVVCGNPKPASRTLTAAVALAERLSDPLRPPTVVDLAVLGPALLEWGNPDVAEVNRAVTAADVVLFASPTFKATFTGLLKLFLDQLPPESLRGTIAVPVMMAAGRDHALAGEVHLRPVLVELGASCPTRAVFFVAGEPARPVIDSWLDGGGSIALAAFASS